MIYTTFLMHNSLNNNNNINISEQKDKKLKLKHYVDERI